MVLAGGGGLNVLRTAGQLGLLHLGQGRTVMTGLVTWRPGAKVSCLAGEASYILLVTFQYTDSLVRHGQLQGGHGGETVPGPAIVGPQGGGQSPWQYFVPVTQREQEKSGVSQEKEGGRLRGQC